uniref:Uncharacterized protein n=1 Tax=Moniliophthora roreri TaxID=221103 RepID=A0A0W0FWQ2_MONRR
MTAHGQYPLPQGWTMGLFDSRGLVIIPSDVRQANTLFDGGETINVTVFDYERGERVYEPFRGWVFPHESPRWAALMEERNLERYFFRSLHLFARNDRQRTLDDYLRRLQQECTLREFCKLLEALISIIPTTPASNTTAG